MDKTQINVERMRACDAEWEEQKHPRRKIAQSMSAKDSASPLQQAAAALRSE